jgi:hypothetical protein
MCGCPRTSLPPGFALDNLTTAPRPSDDDEDRIVLHEVVEAPLRAEPDPSLNDRVCDLIEVAVRCVAVFLHEDECRIHRAGGLNGHHALRLQEEGAAPPRCGVAHLLIIGATPVDNKPTFSPDSPSYL